METDEQPITNPNIWRKKKEKIGTVKALEYKMDTTEQKNKK